MTILHPLPHTRTPTVLLPTAASAAKYVARELDKLIRSRNAAGKPTVLGLATGSTPVGLYRELIRLHKDEGLDFSRVLTFNLDEYYPMPKEDSHSYFRWMHETLFNHINIPWNNIHIPDGTLSPEEADAFCADYEKKIKAAGGIDAQILGIGRTGHIGFNEPGSPRNSRTRMVTLDSITRRDAASSFFGEENVPNQALTMGVASILDARRIFLMAFGEHKAPVIRRAVEGEVSASVAASYLQQHASARIVLDMAAVCGGGLSKPSLATRTATLPMAWMRSWPRCVCRGSSLLLRNTCTSFSPVETINVPIFRSDLKKAVSIGAGPKLSLTLFWSLPSPMTSSSTPA